MKRKSKEIEIQRPIFVIGCCNSGTTILQHALLRHNELEGPLIDSQDLNGMPKIMTQWLINKKSTFRLWTHPMFNLRYYCTENDFRKSDKEALVRVFKTFISNGKRLIAKSPPDTLRARLIQSYFPDAYFIAIVRNGYVVSEGIVRKRLDDPMRPKFKGLQTTIEEAAEQWCRTNVIVLSMNDFLQRYLIIKYEDLVLEPGNVLKSVLTFCDLESDGYSVPRFDTELNQEQIKRLSSNEIKTVTKIAGPMLIHFGYEIQ